MKKHQAAALESKTLSTTKPRADSVPGLLDQVLAEALDPAYREVADRRAASRSTGSPNSPISKNSRRGVNQAAVAIVLVITGFSGAVAYQSNRVEAEGRVGVRAALIEDVVRSTDDVDGLQSQLEQVQSEVDAARLSSLDSTAGGRRALQTLDAAEAGAAATPVKGPGIVITLGDELLSASGDPIGSTQTTLNRVLDRDLASLVNAFWFAGAEAVAINGVRLGPTSAVRAAGGTILVDFQPLLSPYVVSAIGNSTSMQSGLVASADIQFLVGLSNQLNLIFGFEERESISLQAASTTQISDAVPVPG